MADYLARMEAAQRKAEALEMQRQQHMQQDEEDQSIPSSAIVAAAAEEEPPEPVQPSGPQGVLGDYMASLQAARMLHEQRSLAKGKQAQAVIPELDISDANRTGAAAIDVVLKPEVSRGVNTQLAHLARVAAELKDLAGHVGQRAEGKQATALKPRKSRVNAGLQPGLQLDQGSSNVAAAPMGKLLPVEDFSSAQDAMPKSD